MVEGHWLLLARAMICPEEHLFDVAAQTCPACGSAHVMPLERWLGSVRVAARLAAEQVEVG